MLEFPVPDSTDEYTIHGRKYTIRFRASTVVDISPRSDDGLPDYRLYLRNHLRDGRVAATVGPAASSPTGWSRWLLSRS
ncbi:MAG: hypothetical protein U0992_13500 [Planctomycetaceae bacterium]